MSLHRSLLDALVQKLEAAILWSDLRGEGKDLIHLRQLHLT